MTTADFACVSAVQSYVKWPDAPEPRAPEARRIPISVTFDRARRVAAIALILAAPACGERASKPAPDCECGPGAQPAPTAASAEPVQSRALESVAADPMAPPATTKLAKIALKATQDLFAGRYQEVRYILEGPLKADLTTERLDDIVSGVEKAHGPAAQIMDAWDTTLEEDGERWPAASTLVRMQRSRTRFRVLLVFNHDDTVRGFWLRPI